MKLSTKIALIGWPCIFALAWTAMATAEMDQDADSSEDAVIARELQRAAEEIHDRVGMAACLEESLEGDSQVEDAYIKGEIIPVTLEQVESALRAAALTPEVEDDREALRMAHRGSYRFFASDVVPESTQEESVEEE